MRAMYFYALTPVVIVFGTLILMACAYLALIALTVVALAVLAVLVWAIVAMTRSVSRTISRSWHRRSGASTRTAATQDVSTHSYAYAAPQKIDYSPPPLGRSMDVIGAVGRNGVPVQPTLRRGHG